MRRNTIPIRDYVVGLALGQAREPAALAIVEVVWGCRGFRDPYAEEEYEDDEWAYHVVYLEPIERDMSYPDLAALVDERMEAIPVYGKGSPANDFDSFVYLAVDVTHVGAPVVKLFRKRGLSPVPITITVGDTMQRDEGGGYSVPLRDVISGVHVKLQQRQIKVAKELEQAQALMDALLNFRYANNERALDPYGAWREGQDVFVLAVAVAVWYAEHARHNVLRPMDDDLTEAWFNFTGI